LNYFSRKKYRCFTIEPATTTNLDTTIPTQHSPQISRVQHEEVDIATLERDPGLHPPILEYLINQCDEIRWAYIKAAPYQFHLENIHILEKLTILLDFNLI
jgi:hypothetical protein